MRILITGPHEQLETWCKEVQEAGHEAEPWPLVQVQLLDHDLVDDIDGLPDWLCVTSPNALPAIEAACLKLPELRSVPAAVVGPRSAEATASQGFKVEVRGNGGARDLAAALKEHASAATGGPAPSVLWPRGNLSQELGNLLREAGFQVHDPIVYETSPLELSATFPASEAVFFASPSAVRSWPATEHRSLAIAIGRTTLAALDELAASPFDRHLALETPKPSALVELLGSHH